MVDCVVVVVLRVGPGGAACESSGLHVRTGTQPSGARVLLCRGGCGGSWLSLIHISEPTRLALI
eukprot:4567657-Alexandrium_andersonii.AAC.1